MRAPTQPREPRPSKASPPDSTTPRSVISRSLDHDRGLQHRRRNLALRSNTTGTRNTAIGYQALYLNTTGSYSVGIGLNTLFHNTTGSFNSANGYYALFNNTTGSMNVANGLNALYANTSGSNNTANGFKALFSNTTGENNNAVGTFALKNNIDGSDNTAVGDSALNGNISGPFNTAVGFQALMNATENANAAVGDRALEKFTTGFFNTAIGAAAGFNQTTGHNNIYIGQGSQGVAGESNTCYIQGIAGSSIPTANSAFVFVDLTTGKLGTVIAAANGNKVTVPILQSQLQAVPQGQPKAIPRYFEDGHQAMLNRKVEKQQATIAELKSTVAQPQKGMKNSYGPTQRAGRANPKVSAQIEVSKSAPQVVANP